MKHPWVVLSVPAEMGKNNNIKDSSSSDKSLKKRWSRRKQGHSSWLLK